MHELRDYKFCSLAYLEGIQPNRSTQSLWNRPSCAITPLCACGPITEHIFDFKLLKHGGFFFHFCYVSDNCHITSLLFPVHLTHHGLGVDVRVVLPFCCRLTISIAKFIKLHFNYFSSRILCHLCVYLTMNFTKKKHRYCYHYY